MSELLGYICNRYVHILYVIFAIDIDSTHLAVRSDFGAYINNNYECLLGYIFRRYTHLAVLSDFRALKERHVQARCIEHQHLFQLSQY
jgi:hypothetical protein